MQTLRVKFTINITDPTAEIDATVFPEVAEEIYGLTRANITIDAPDNRRSWRKYDIPINIKQIFTVLHYPKKTKHKKAQKKN